MTYRICGVCAVKSTVGIFYYLHILVYIILISKIAFKKIQLLLTSNPLKYDGNSYDICDYQYI